MFTSNGAGPAQSTSRRTFLKHTGTIATASTLVGVTIPHVHAASDDTIKLALIGCGGRGSGAVANTLSAPGGPVKLVAMADIFEDRLKTSHQTLSQQFGDKIDVPPERRFLGFDAYRKAIDCLGPRDVAMLTDYTAFRPTAGGQRRAINGRWPAASSQRLSANGYGPTVSRICGNRQLRPSQDVLANQTPAMVLGSSQT
jgi:hypothetical protein